MSNANLDLINAAWNGTINTAKNDYGLTTSFSGSDMLVQIMFPGSKAISLGTATTLTYSIYREKKQVRTLGRMSAKGTTKGPMTVAGTLIFTVINQHVINDIRDALYQNNNNDPIAAVQRLRFDELPPFDLIITFANEYGASAQMIIYGITTTDEAMVFSIEDLFTENTMTYMARDIDTMRGPVSNNMNMYAQSGSSYDTNSEMLPKYNFDQNQLWPNIFAQYEQSLAQKLASDLSNYGSKYVATPVYTPTYSQPNQAPASGSGYGSLQVIVKKNTGGTISLPVSITMTVNGKATVKTTSGGTAIFSNIPLSLDRASATVKLSSAVYHVVSQPGAVTVTSESSPIVTIVVADNATALAPSGSPNATAPRTVTTGDIISIAVSAVESNFPAVGVIDGALNLAGLKSLKHYISDVMDTNWVERALNSCHSIISKGSAYTGQAVNTIQKFLKNNWKAVLVAAGVAGIALTILTGGADLIIAALGEAIGAAVSWIAGLIESGSAVWAITGAAA